MKLAFLASPDKKAQTMRCQLEARYGKHSAANADIFVVLGGDGMMLHTLRQNIISKNISKPLYGINMGSVGFLMNRPGAKNLPDRIAAARTTILHPLTMDAQANNKKHQHALAINEISLFRQSPQTAYIRISIDGKVRMETLVADGILLSSAAGSTAYNFSAGGPIIPVGAEILALTPISAFRPRRWRGALLPSSAHVRFESLDPKKRPVSAVADHTEIRNIVRVDISEDKSIKLPILFDPDHGLEERILSEQFQS